MKILHRYLAATQAATGRGGTALRRAPRPGEQIDLTGVLGVLALSFDLRPTSENNQLLPWLKLLSKYGQAAQKIACGDWTARPQRAAGGGRSATRRIDMVSSSSWKCGRRNATARYAPGLPGISDTSMRASRSGRCALIARLRRRRWRRRSSMIQLFRNVSHLVARHEAADLVAHHRPSDSARSATPRRCTAAAPKCRAFALAASVS